MVNAVSSVKWAACLMSCALGVTLGGFASRTSAQTIDLGLNLLYADPASQNSGGTWQVIGRTSTNFGIASLSLRLVGVTTAQNQAPRGTVNGSDGAGFWLFSNTSNDIGVHNITVAQVPIDELAAGDEQTLFYGVGSFQNGSPRYPAQPPLTNSLPPTFTSLTSVMGVPWAPGDPLGDLETAALFASGTFAPGVIPEFFPGSAGNVFTSQGTSTTPGDITPATNVTTIVRTNFSGPALPDYNDNGVVDAADYVLWRKTLGQTGAGLPADGDGDLMVDNDDYLLWRTHFGATVPGAGAGLSTSTVPEPASYALLAIGATLIARGRSTRRPVRRESGC